ncbi:MAG TPA: response regulator transcription factor [Chroococcales cyanobacterium]|jgi:DNA-binding response OmpR family regulator
MKILVIEDEAPVRRGLIDLLEAKGYGVFSAASGNEGLLKAKEGHPDLILLDVMLPGLSGWDVLRGLRSEKSEIPVIMLTAKGSEIDKVLGFELGVDDYVTKPFSLLELLGRIQAVLRRANPGEGIFDEFLLGQTSVDLEKYEVRRGEKVLELPATAFEILKVLAKARGNVVSRDQLIDEVWGKDQEVNTRTIDNLVVKIRQVIEADLHDPRFLKTVHGRGYRLIK